MAIKKTTDEQADDFLAGKPVHVRELFEYFIKQYRLVGAVTVHPAKTMVGIATPRKRICYITQFGKDFIHVVFSFETAYAENLCFQKIAQVPGQKQFNHHFRMYRKEDLNVEVKGFMRLAYTQGV